MGNAGKISKTTRVAATGIAVLLTACSVKSASGAEIGFSGVVTSHETQTGIQEYPRLLVSFSDRVALPVVFGRADREGVRVFDGGGNPVPSFSAGFSADSIHPQAQIVDLGNQTLQTFTVCAGRNCIRYRVVRR